MSAFALKFRGPVIAVVVLLFSAGLALAGGGLVFPETGSGPTADEGAGNHGDLVSQAAEMETPAGFKNHGAFVSCVARKLYEDDSEAGAGEVVLAELTPADCERDDSEAENEAETDDPADTAEDGWKNHGAMVSEAAQMETPDGFKNHGAFVSCVAKLSYGKKGSEAPAEFVLADLTPEDCAKSDKDEAKADKAKDKAEKAKAKADRKDSKGDGEEN